MFKKLIKAALLSLGYEIRKLESPEEARLTPFESSFQRAAKLIRPYTMLSQARLYSLFQQAAYCEDNGVVGAFVEWASGKAVRSP